MNCENGNHEYIVEEEFTGGTRYKCRKCGHEYVEGTLLGPNNDSQSIIFECNCVIDVTNFESMNDLGYGICVNMYPFSKQPEEAFI